jgi:hypothetical protein
MFSLKCYKFSVIDPIKLIFLARTSLFKTIQKINWRIVSVPKFGPPRLSRVCNFAFKLLTFQSSVVIGNHSVVPFVCCGSCKISIVDDKKLKTLMICLEWHVGCAEHHIIFNLISNIDVCHVLHSIWFQTCKLWIGFWKEVC